MQKKLELYKKIGKKYNISEHIVEHVVRHQFSFLQKSLENSKLPSILLHRLGTFKVKNGRLDFLIRNLESKIEKGKIDKNAGIKELEKLLKIKNNDR